MATATTSSSRGPEDEKSAATHVPLRIKSSVPLELKKSELPGRDDNGKGVFVLGAIKSGDLIFAIKDPLLVLSEDIDNKGGFILGKKCDNCFATILEVTNGETLLSIPFNDIEAKVSACAGCRAVCYCKKSCQKSAWAHHHKYECKAYAAVKGNAHGNQGNSAITQPYVRYLIRVVELRQHGMISDDLWQDILSLSKPDFVNENRADFISYCSWLAGLVKATVETELSEDEIRNLAYGFQHNQLDALIPLMKGPSKYYLPDRDSITKFGAFLDPFVSKVRHSCVSNAWCVLNGKGIEVRATKDIDAGSELTFSYLPGRNPQKMDFEERTRMLKKQCGIICKCSLCNQGMLGPSGDIRKRMLKQLAQQTQDPLRFRFEDYLAETERVIGEMEATGFGEPSHMMLPLYELAEHGYFITEQTIKAFQTTLKIYFLIQPSTTPATPLHRRLITLFRIITHAMPPTEEYNIQALPAEIMVLANKVVLPLEELLGEGTARCFGKDSLIAKYESECVDFLMSVKEITFQTMGMTNFRQKRVFSDGEEKGKFVDSMNKLLAWADIPARTFEQMMP